VAVELGPGWELMFGRDGADSGGAVESGGRGGAFWACARDEAKQRTPRTSVAAGTRARRTLLSPPRNRVTAVPGPMTPESCPKIARAQAEPYTRRGEPTAGATDRGS